MKREGRTPSGRVVGGAADEDVVRELRSHVTLREDALVGAGWDRAEARAEAERSLGDLEAVARECTEIAKSHQRAVRRSRMFETMGQDIRYGVRSLLASPGFTVVALITLALGIGANTAIFSVVNGVLLRPLPYPDPDELYWIDEVAQSGRSMTVAWPNFEDWQRESDGFRALTAYSPRTATILGGAEPVQVPSANVSEQFWQVFGVQATQGRLTLPEDHVPDVAPVAVVSDFVAEEVLGGGSAIGRSIDISGRGYEIVGVVDRSFDFPAGAQVWVTAETGDPGSRTAHNYRVVGRIGPGSTPQAVEQQLDAFQERIAAGASASDLAYLATGVNVVPLREELVGDARTPLLILLGAAGFVLLVACTNLASTLLARGTVRARELAVRSALGGTKSRLVRQLLTESLVLATVGAAAGVALAALILRVLRRLGEGAIPRLENVSVDGWVLLFALAIAGLTAVAFGLLPALRGAEGGQADTLRASGRANAGRRGRTWDILVVVEVALALVLLVGSGLLIRSFATLLSEDGGFDPSDVAMATVALGTTRYPELADHVLYWDRLLAEAERVPGVSSVGLLTNLPVTSVPNGRVALNGDPNDYGDALYLVASEGAFGALDIPLIRGRLFDERDGPGAPHAVVVSESFAKEYWPDEDPIGRLVSGGGMDNYWEADPVVFGTVVGTVGEVRYSELGRPGGPTVYWNYRQRPFRTRFGATLLAESVTGDPSLVAQPLRSIVRQADDQVPVQIRYMKDVVLDSLGDRTFMLFVLGGFAALALILAAVGIYGVVAYSVAQRTREMGVRLALGAQPDSVRGLVLKGALRPVVIGLVLGVLGGRLLSGVVEGFLYEVEPSDPLTFVGVSLLLLLAALVASWVPAFRGTRVDPIIAMRAE